LDQAEWATVDAFSGPVSESVPSSVVGFQHRGRQGSVASISSYTYFNEADHTPSSFSDEEALLSDDEDALNHDDLENGQGGPQHRKSSSKYRNNSVAEPLLRRSDTARSDTQKHEEGGSFSQKLYIEAEDLTIVAAGFQTSRLGFLLYILISVLTAGIGWLVLHWFGRWRIRLVGKASPLRTCSWVVVEVRYGPERKHGKKAKKFQNQWGEFTVHQVASEEYGYPLSSIFTAPSKEKMNGHRYDEDAEVAMLRYVDYRYMRLLYHPLEDKFVLNNDWWDPQWTSVKALREGLDAEEREPREQVFGKNLIEIQQKTIPQLLLDEVGSPISV
jgi:cation-transporting P-type ATPase 13A2